MTKQEKKNQSDTENLATAGDVRIMTPKVVNVNATEREVTENEIIGIWLQREFDSAWDNPSMPLKCLLQHISGFTKEKIKADYITHPNYDDANGNTFRLKLLFTFRAPLLLPLINAKWVERELTEDEFRQLKVIKATGWDFLSDYIGEISKVAEKVQKKDMWHLQGECKNIVDTIYRYTESASHDKMDRTLILLSSPKSKFTTVLEGNKNGVAYYIKCFLKKELTYKPLRVFIGNLENPCLWQW